MVWSDQPIPETTDSLDPSCPDRTDRVDSRGYRHPESVSGTDCRGRTSYPSLRVGPVKGHRWCIERVTVWGGLVVSRKRLPGNGRTWSDVGGGGKTNTCVYVCGTTVVGLFHENERGGFPHDYGRRALLEPGRSLRPRIGTLRSIVSIPGQRSGSSNLVFRVLPTRFGTMEL